MDDDDWRRRIDELKARADDALAAAERTRDEGTHHPAPLDPVRSAIAEVERINAETERVGEVEQINAEIERVTAENRRLVARMVVRAIEQALGGDAARSAEKALEEVVRALDEGRFDDALPMMRAFAAAVGMDVDRVVAAFLPPDEAPLT